jgi:WD40 repeat protein
VYGLALFALGMTVFAAVASREHHSTETARDEAQSRLVALEAGNLRASDPSLAMQLTLVGYRLGETTQARSALVEATAGEMPTRLLGQPGPTPIALGDDGHRLAIAYGASDQLKLYSLRYSRLRWLVTVPAGRSSAKVDAVAISRNGRLLASADSGGLVTLWSLALPAHPKRLATLSLGSEAVYGLSFSPRGAALAAADANGSVQRWSLSSPGHLVGSPEHPVTEPVLVAPGRPALHAVSYSRNGNTIAAVGRDGALVIWHAHAGTTPMATLTAGTRLLAAVTYSPDSRTLASAGEDGLIHLLRLTKAGSPAIAETPLTGAGPVTSLAFSRDGRYLAAGASDDALRIWSTSRWREIATLPGPAAVTAAAFTDHDRHILSSDAAGTIRIWQFPPPSGYEALAGVRTLTYSPGEPQLEVTGGKTGRKTIQWDVADEWRPAPAGAWYAAPASAATSGVYASSSGTTTSGTTTSGTTTSGTTTSGTTTSGTTTSGTGTPAVNPQAGGVALRQTRAATRVIGSALSPNGELFAAAGADHLVWLWNVTDPSQPKLLAKLAGFKRWAYTVVFSSSSQTLFAGGAEHTVRIWDLSQPNAPQELKNSPLTGPSSTIKQLALSPDDRTLAALTADGQVWMWAVASPSKAYLTATLTAATGHAAAIAFSPTDNILVASGKDGRLTFWHYRPYQAVNRICALSGTPITPTEWQQYVPGAPYNPPCATWMPPVPPANSG